jgi:hypothetical protein
LAELSLQAGSLLDSERDRVDPTLLLSKQFAEESGNPETKVTMQALLCIIFVQE